MIVLARCFFFSQGRCDAAFEICRRMVIEGTILQGRTQSNLAAIDKIALFALFKVLFNFRRLNRVQLAVNV